MHAYLNYPKYEELPNAIALIYKQHADICESICLGVRSEVKRRLLAKSSVRLRVPKYAPGRARIANIRILIHTALLARTKVATQFSEKK